MRKLKIFFLAATVIGFVFLSGGCKKTTENITQGTDSVYSSGWFIPSLTLDVNDSLYEGTISNSAITSAVVDNGVVLSYVGTVGQLPNSTTQDTLSSDAILYDVYVTEAIGSIFIQSEPTYYDGIADFTAATNGGYAYYFRYVIIPGSVLATTGLTKQQAKSMTYTALTAALAKAKQTSNASIPQ